MLGTRPITLYIAALLSSTLDAQPLQRPLCGEGRELCSDDELQIGFGREWRESVFESAEFAAGTPITAALVLSVESSSIRGIATAIAHDPDVLELPAQGLRALHPLFEQADSEGFLALRTVTMHAGRTTGFLVSVIPSFVDLVYLPVGRIPLVEMTYELRSDAGTEGTRIAFSELLGDPPVQTVLTIERPTHPPLVVGPEGNCIDGVDNDLDGLIDRDDIDCDGPLAETWRPRFVTDGLVRRARRGDAAARPASFLRGDCDGDGDATTMRDALVLLSYVFLSGLEPSCLDACDTDGDDPAALTVSDAVYALNHALFGDSPPPLPYPECGPSPSDRASTRGCRLESSRCAETP